jgi:acetolactate synthase-1/2/3 large subunit
MDVPVDIANQQTDFTNYPSSSDIRSYPVPRHGEMRNIEAAASLISRAKRPLLYVGGGVNLAGAAKELTEFARANRIPVTTTLNGLGAFPESDPLSLKMLGMHGTMYSNFAVQESDLLIAVAARFDDRVTGDISKFAPKAKVVHLDIDPSSIDKNVQVDVEIIGDVKFVLRQLLKKTRRPQTAKWLKHLENLKRRYPLKYAAQDGHIASQYVIEEIGKVTGHQATVATGVGQHQMWTAQWYGFEKQRQLITSGGLGTMGFGIPASIGAQFARPKETVFCIDGDGSAAMTIIELATAVYYDQPVKIAILDNNYLGMVRQWQELFYNRRYSSVELGPISPDFVKMAESMGALGMRVERPEEVRSTLERAMDHNGPVLMHFRVEKESNVYPMVPAGQALDQMIDMA